MRQIEKQIQGILRDTSELMPQILGALTLFFVLLTLISLFFAINL